MSTLKFIDKIPHNSYASSERWDNFDSTSYVCWWILWTVFRLIIPRPVMWFLTPNCHYVFGQYQESKWRSPENITDGYCCGYSVGGCHWLLMCAYTSVTDDLECVGVVKDWWALTCLRICIIYEMTRWPTIKQILRWRVKVKIGKENY